MRRFGRWLVVVLGLLVVGLLVLGASLERLLNRVEPVPLPEVGAAARSLHAGAFVADLHADSLLFGRDLLERSEVGHVDLPRLREGGVALQAFTIVTKTPLGMNIDRTPADAPDMLTIAGLATLSPRAFRAPFERARAQLRAFDALVARSEGGLVPVRTRQDLDRLRAARRAAAAGEGPMPVGGLLGLEGAHALGGDPDNLGALYDEGVRMIGLTHFFDNAFAGSAHGTQKGGLTARGAALVDAMEARGVVIDLAHLSPRAVRDVLARSEAPPVVSHGGVRGTCDNARNLSDAQLRAIAAAGGVVGIGYWRTAVCGTELRHVVAAMRHVIEVVGEDHVALGSDYDGGVTVGFDTRRLPALTQALLDAGLAEETVQKILGGNVLRVLRAVLPSEAS